MGKIHVFLLYHHVSTILSSFSRFFPKKSKLLEPDIQEWYYFGYYHIKTQQHQHYYSEKYEEHTLAFFSDVSPLWIVKKPDMYLSNIHSPVSYDLLQNSVKSEVSFLYIEYTFGNKSIPLNISDDYMYIGNELFSPAFVLRLLEHQTDYYDFDRDYKITILDHHLIPYEISYYQYVILEKNQIQIKNH